MSKFVTLMVGALAVFMGNAALATESLDGKSWDPKKFEYTAEYRAVSVVAQVGQVFAKDGLYDKWHQKLSKDLTGVPSLEEFRKQDWVTVIASRSTLMPGVFKGWGGVELGLKVGDVVELKVGKREAKDYDEVGRVVRVICRRGDATYAECAKANPRKMIDAAGEEIKADTIIPEGY